MTNNWMPEELAKRMVENPDLAKENPAGVWDVAKLMGQPAFSPTVAANANPLPANKYRVAKKENRTYNGRLYASKKEANFAQKLDLLVKAGDIDFYLEQVPFRLPGNVVYRLDFLTFAHRAGVWSVHFIEVKGYRTRLGEIKRRQAEELFGISIEVV